MISSSGVRTDLVTLIRTRVHSISVSQWAQILTCLKHEYFVSLHYLDFGLMFYGSANGGSFVSLIIHFMDAESVMI